MRNDPDGGQATRSGHAGGARRPAPSPGRAPRSWPRSYAVRHSTGPALTTGSTSCTAATATTPTSAPSRSQGRRTGGDGRGAGAGQRDGGHLHDPACGRGAGGPYRGQPPPLRRDVGTSLPRAPAAWHHDHVRRPCRPGCVGPRPHAGHARGPDRAAYESRAFACSTSRRRARPRAGRRRSSPPT